MTLLTPSDYDHLFSLLTGAGVVAFVFLLSLWIATRPKPLQPQLQEIDSKVEKLDLNPSWIPVQLFKDDNDDKNAYSNQWRAPPHAWRSAAEPERLKGRHRELEQPYFPDCIWEVDPGPCRVWKWPCSLHQLQKNKYNRNKNHEAASLLESSKSNNEAMMMIAHYQWDSVVPPRAALIMVHGLASHTMFQFLRRAPDGEKLRRGLYYQGSFIERCTETLGIACYGMDMEGHGFSFDHQAPHVMFMQEGVKGGIMDLQRLLEYVRKQHGWEDYSKIFLIGHSTGCLVITRAIQDLELTRKQNVVVGGIISTGPLYGRANYDGSESLGTKLSSKSFVAAGLFAFGLGILKQVSKHYLLSSAYTTQADDARNNSSCHPSVIAKSASPGRFIEKWVSGDRDLDPLFHSPYTPIYPGLIHSTVTEIYALFLQAPFTLHACPLLVMQSPYDPVVSFHAAERFFRQSGSADKEFFAPPEACHMLHNLMLETEGRDHVFSKIFDWLEKRLPVPGSMPHAAQSHAGNGRSGSCFEQDL